MEAINVIYKFGNLYDKTTKKRIVINDGTEISLVLNSRNDILPEDPNLTDTKPLLNAEQKEQEVKIFCKKQARTTRYWKLFTEGKALFFEISAGVRTRNEVKVFRYTFKIALLEDLYIYNKKSEPKYARFFDCRCKVQECFPEFDFFEPIAATSLNDAYTKTYELYFAIWQIYLQCLRPFFGNSGYEIDYTNTD